MEMGYYETQQELIESCANLHKCWAGKGKLLPEDPRLLLQVPWEVRDRVFLLERELFRIKLLAEDLQKGEKRVR